MTDQTTLLEIESDGGNGVQIMRVRGELDLTNASALEEALDGTCAGAVILDLSAVVFVDSAGIRTIDAAYQRLHQDDRALLVVAPPESRAGWTFRVAGFTNDFVLDSVDAARSLANEEV